MFDRPSHFSTVAFDQLIQLKNKKNKNKSLETQTGKYLQTRENDFSQLLDNLSMSISHSRKHKYRHQPRQHHTTTQSPTVSI